jgi:polysaccharide pyruvyl transferase WcaK-like protein
MPVVGLNPMAFCDPRIWPREDYSVYCRYLDKLASFCSWLLGQHYRLQLFTTSISVDQYAIEDLEKRLLCDWPSDRISKMVQPVSLSLKEFLIKMSELDFVITSRFHAVVFSHLLGKPVIALSYHSKIGALMRTVGHYEYCMDIELFNANSLIERFGLLVRNGLDLQSKFRKAVDTYYDVQRVQFDSLFWQRG